MKIALIRVRTLPDILIMDNHGSAIEKAFPGLKVTPYCIEDQHSGVYDEESEAKAIPKVARIGKQIRDADAIVVSCAADPGVSQLKKELRVPVVGAGEAVARVSKTLGTSVGVITITGNVPAVIRADLGPQLRAWRKVAEVTTALDLESEKSGEGVLAAAGELVGQGCDVIALACTGFCTIGIASVINKRFQVPVVDPVWAAGAVLYTTYLANR
jgi:Asp/Glu/hydantoin racemase